MLVPVKWLKDYININEDVKEFADKMTMTGSKVEKVEYLGECVDKIVLGKIKEIEKHPDADKLVITKIDINEEEYLQIVTGANNINIGDFIPVATIGAKLPNGMKIKKGKLRGVPSFGMLCSSEELGIPFSMVDKKSKDGIYILDFCEKATDSNLGKDIKDILDLDDYVIEFEITSNRPDCLSVMGLVKEASATIDEDYKMPNMEFKEYESDLDVDIQIDDKDLCNRYYARLIEDVKIEPSPYWLQRRLIEAGIRPINNIVDITNFVMHEMGQPLHAFDLDKLASNKIIVKRASDNQVFTTLDSEERKLSKDDLMINDENGAIAIAGVMGGQNTEVSDDTTKILLESANFSDDSVRRTSKKLGLRTEASAKFEKGIDSNTVELAINRACHLIEKLNAGKVLKVKKDVYINERECEFLKVKPSRINKLLGEDINTDTMIELLAKVEIKANKLESDLLELKIPTFRLDISQEADILEEVARIYGYDKIKSSRINGVVTLGIKTKDQELEENMKNLLTSMGLNEILTYSFVSPKIADKIAMPKDDVRRDFIKLQNPLGEETSVMRTTLMPNLLEVASSNNSKSIKEFRGFEIGNTFFKGEEEPLEIKNLCFGFYSKDADFFVLKGILEELYAHINFNNYEILPETNNTSFHTGRCAKIVMDDQIIGYLGEIHPDVMENYNLDKRVYVCEFDFEKVFNNLEHTIKYKPLPKYPSSSRDLAITLKDDIVVKDIEDIIIKNKSNIIESFELFDLYKGDQIEKGYKSVAYSIVYRNKERTLTDEEVTKVHDKIVKDIEEKLGGKLR